MQNIRSKDNEKYQVSLLTAFNCTKSWKVFNLINYMTINIPNNTCSAVKKRHYFLLPCTAILSNWEGQKAEFKSIDLPLRLFCSAGSTIYIFLFFTVPFTSGRILTGCYWFCILIWVSTYTANLAAFFTVKYAEHPINNLEDLAKSNYETGVIHSGATYQAFKESQYKTHKKIWHRMKVANTFPPSIAEGVQWVRERERFVFISEGPTLRHAAKEPPCNLKSGNYSTLVEKIVC